MRIQSAGSGQPSSAWPRCSRRNRRLTSKYRVGVSPARLLDMVEERSKQAFKQWLSGRPKAWRDGIELVAMDGFTGFKTAAAEEIPAAVAVMDPCRVVRLAGEALDKCRRRMQLAVQEGRRWREEFPLFFIQHRKAKDILRVARCCCPRRTPTFALDPKKIKEPRSSLAHPDG